MDKHRVIIGWLFEAVTMLLAVFVTFAWEKAFGTDGTPQKQQVVIYAVVIAALFLAVGLTLLLNYRNSHWVCLPFSVMMLVYVPLGTALGGYYLWYFWKFVYRRGKS
ncbi:MAG: hypothetical protein Q7U91_04385 [Sideroxyarcus sp.]|nr:hypothetical protein [Sideroxyarcus sp.]